jgi:hypothetical protein
VLSRTATGCHALAIDLKLKLLHFDDTQLYPNRSIAHLSSQALHLEIASFAHANVPYLPQI